jgi:hypothetical protein
MEYCKPAISPEAKMLMEPEEPETQTSSTTTEESTTKELTKMVTESVADACPFLLLITK